MSTGELRIDGPLATYELRMPMYEIAHVAHPATDLIEHVHFAGALRVASNCREDGDAYVCLASYEFPRVIDAVDVTCTLYEITVPNHVHLLTATAGKNSDQAVFDRTITRRVLHLRPPSPLEEIARAMFGGIWHALASPLALFLIALAMAARSKREAALLIAMYIAGEWLIQPVAPRIPWPLTPRFLEAAMALTVAYLAVEILALPKAGNRAPIALALGLLHGLYFASFPLTYLAGATLFQAIAIALLAALALRWATPRRHRAAAIVVLAGGLAWFAFRLIQK